jgi:hypothetical protein
MAGTSFQNAGAEPLQEVNSAQTRGHPTVDRPAIGWLDSIEEDLRAMGVRNWRRKSQYRDQWKAIVKEANAHHGL